MTSHAILVHGAFADQTAWTHVLPLLAQHDLLATTVPLPGHTDADGAAAGRFTLTDYAAAVAAALADHADPVLLVGHSMAGMVITQVAEQHPERIAALVYLSAYLPENGRTLLSYAQTDTQSKLGPGLVIDEPHGLATISPAVMRAAFFNNTPAAEADAGVERLRPEPLQPFVFPVTTSADRFGRVPRYYITTERDAAVGPALQRAMIAALPCARVYSLDTDHSSYVSQPRELSEALASIASEGRLLSASTSDDACRHDPSLAVGNVVRFP